MKETDGGKGSYKVNTFIFKELTITINQIDSRLDFLVLWSQDTLSPINLIPYNCYLFCTAITWT